MHATVKEVSSRRDLKKFIAFPNKLFRNVPTYIPPLIRDEMGLLTRRNPSLDHCDLALFLAYDTQNNIVGRVAAIINHNCNKHWNRRTVRFGWCDFVEDYEVFLSLMNAVIDFGHAHGMDEIEGPLGFTDMDKECWMISNFDQRQNISTLYNPEYYISFVQRFGMQIQCRWMQYQMPASQPIPEKVARINGMIQERYNLRLLKFKNRKEVFRYARKFFYAINASFKDLYDFVPLTEEEISVYVNEYFPFTNLEFTNFVVDQNDDVVAFGLSIPDLSRAYQRANGHLFPFGWFYILRALHHFDTIDLLLNGVHPDWQKRGVHSLYYSEMNKCAIKYNVKTAYTNPQIIGNDAVKIWGNQYQATPLMERAVFGMPI